MKYFILFILFTVSFTKFKGQTCNYISTYSLSYPNSYPIYPILKGDFNNDSKTDVVKTLGGNAVTFLQVNTNSFSIVSNTLINEAFFLTADFNNDTKLDLIAQNYIYMGQGNGTFTQAVSGQTLTSVPLPGNVVAGDFNNDNNKDFIFSNGDIKTYLGQGNGTFNAPITYSTPSVSYGQISTSDYNSDGNLDIAVTTNTQIVVFKGNGSGSFTPTISLSSYSVSSPPRILASDINNDGKKDLIIIYSNSTSTISTIINNGNFTFSNLQTFTCPVVGTADVGDFNNDGFIDISAPTYYGNVAMMFYNNGAGQFTTTNSFNYPVGAFSANNCVAGDFNNDNISDLAVVTTSAGSVTFLYSYNGDCIWPGDANGNWTVNNADFLELGLQFNQTGAARTSTGNVWNGVTYTAWNGLTSNGKNKANSDCNGDGTVNLIDTLAIYNNYNLFHTKSSTSEISTTDISIIPDQTDVLKNTWGTASIFLGDATNNISNIHGVAFDISYNNTLIETDSIWIEYISSFINSNNLNFRKRDFPNGVLYTATTHTNQVNVSGNGKIAILHYKIKSTLPANAVLNLSLANGVKSSTSAASSSLSCGSGTLNAVISIGIKENVLNAFVSVYPNPSSGQITIKQLDKNNICDMIQIYDAVGQLVFSKKINTMTQAIDTNLSKGIYFYSLSNSSGQTLKNKLIIE